MFQPRREPMTAVEHLEELRWRILYSLGAWVIFSLGAFVTSRRIIDFLTRPVPKLVFLSPAEAFLAHVKIAVIGGGILAFPFVLYQVLLFVLPAMTPREKRGILWILPAALLFFAAGACFAYFVLLPFALKFFLSYTSERVEGLISLSNYVGFVLSFLVGGGAAFELPLLMMGLGKIGIVKSSMLRRYRKEAFLAILIATAILSPSPDVFSWSLLSVSMYALFELSLWLVRLVES